MTNAQSLQDALRYSRPEQSGTARYMAMGGAFNANNRKKKVEYIGM
jgi:hypothetical protein